MPSKDVLDIIASVHALKDNDRRELFASLKDSPTTEAHLDELLQEQAAQAIVSAERARGEAEQDFRTKLAAMIEARNHALALGVHNRLLQVTKA